MLTFSVDRGGDGGGDTAVAEEGPAGVEALAACIRPRLGGEYEEELADECGEISEVFAEGKIDLATPAPAPSASDLTSIFLQGRGGEQ